MGLPPPESVPQNIFRPDAPGAARVVSNTRLTSEGCDDVRHIVLDVGGLGLSYLEGQSLGVLVPGVDGPRYYSIASPRAGDDGAGGTVSLCVKRSVFVDPETGEERRGGASNYVCDRAPGDALAIMGPSGTRFLLPEEAAANLILVATGTGIAPFRGFLGRVFRELPGWAGEVFLFYGVKSRAEILYREEIEAYRARPDFHFAAALSREEQTPAGEWMHVDHRMAERVARVWELLSLENTYMYICGVKGTEDRIFRTLDAHAVPRGASWPALHERLIAAGRLMVETY